MQSLNQEQLWHDPEAAALSIYKNRLSTENHSQGSPLHY